MNLPRRATAEAKSMAPNTYILGGGAKDWIKTATSSMRRCPRGPKWRVSVLPPSSNPRAASTTALSSSLLPAVPTCSSGATSSLLPNPGPSITVAIATGDCSARAACQRLRSSPTTLPVHPLDEDVDDPTTGQAHPEGLVVGDTVGEVFGFTALDGGHRLFEHGGFHTPPANGTGNLPILRNGHRGPWSQRPRPLDLHHGRQRGLLPLLTPTRDLVDYRVHRDTSFEGFRLQASGFR